MLIGHLDHVGEDRIAGWARDESDPARRVVLELFDGEQRIARFVADRMRSDLAKAGMGDGRYGFWLQLPASLFPMPVHRVSVRFADTGTDIGGSPKILYRKEAGTDEAFARWVEAHVDGAIAAADRADLLNPLLDLSVNLTARILAAYSRFDTLNQSTALDEIDLDGLPEVLRRTAKHASADLKPVHVPLQREPSLSVVVAVSGRLGDDLSLIRSVVAAAKGLPIELLLVDNSGAVETAMLPFLVRGGARVMRIDRPKGVVAAYAEGAAMARGGTLLFLSGLKALSERALHLMLATLEAEGRAHLIAPRLVDGDRVAAFGVAIDPLGTRAAIGHGAHVARMPFRVLHEADDLPLNALMIDRARLEEIGGFQGAARYLDYAGSHLSFAVRARGGRTLVQGAADATLAGPVIGVPGSGRGRSLFLARWNEAMAALSAAQSAGDPRVALMIDEQLPSPDEDAASVAVLSHALALRRLGYSVEFAATGRAPDAAGRAEALRARGIEAHDDVDNVEQFLKARPGHFDLVYLHRFHVAEGLLEVARATNPKARLVFSVADLHHVRDERSRVLAGKPDEATVAATRAAEFRCIEAADLVVTHSTFEQDYLRQHAPRAKVAVALWHMPVARGDVDIEGRSGLCFLGNYRHAPNADAVRHFIANIWPHLPQAGAKGGFEIAGAHSNLVDGSGLPAGCGIAGYVRDIGAYLRGKRVMVAPLRFGAGVKGKVLLSLALGLPCVMSPIAAEGIPLSDTLRDALVTSDDTDFARKVAALQGDDGLWLATARASIDWARETLSEDAVTQAIESAIGGRAEPLPARSLAG